MSEQERLWKVLNADGTPCHGGTGKWKLPAKDGPGGWMPPIQGDLVPCENGYHLCRKQNLVYWLSGVLLYEAECRGECVAVHGPDGKLVVREARLLREVDTWMRQTRGLWACDCAEHVLPIYEAGHPGDGRVRNCIEVTRRFIRGKATEAELALAGDAAWVASWAVWGDAGDAVWAARATIRAVRNATGDATGDAGDAVWAAACKAAQAAWEAEYEWQTKRLMEYLYPEEGRTSDAPPVGE